MRLIDADAARDELLECAAEGQLTEREARIIFDRQPVVRCRECKHVLADGTGTFLPCGRGCLCGDNFERRQRTGQEADDAAADAWFGGEPR